MSATVAATFMGDLTGFLALLFIGLTALFMFVRARLLRRMKSLQAYRLIHMAIAALAGLFVVLHATTFLSYPLGLGVLLGYASGALALVVWFTGTAFLEKVRNSLFFHGPLSVALGALIVIHATSAGTALPFFWTELALGSAIAVVLANGLYHLRRGVSHG
jgi:hypothetical protein